MRIVDNSCLTEREKDIILYLVEGEIAEFLCLSVATIKTNIENIYCKFDVHNKVELVIYLIKNKIVEI